MLTELRCGCIGIEKEVVGEGGRHHRLFWALVPCDGHKRVGLVKLDTSDLDGSCVLPSAAIVATITGLSRAIEAGLHMAHEHVCGRGCERKTHRRDASAN